MVWSYAGGVCLILSFAALPGIKTQSSSDEGRYMTRAADDLCIISELSVITAENYLQCLKQCLSMGISCQALTYYTDNVCGLSNSTGVADNCTSAGAVTYISAPKLPLAPNVFTTVVVDTHIDQVIVFDSQSISRLFEYDCDTVYDIRLADGQLATEGRIELRRGWFEEWGTICDDLWDKNDANYVCKELGYSGGALSASSGAAYGEGSGKIWLDSLGCTGNETRLSECSSDGWGNHNCGHSEDAGAVCKEWEVRLVDGPDDASGRVELRNSRDGAWGTVCDDLWDINDAIVLCRSLDYFGALNAPGSAHFGQGVGDIWIDNMECVNDEAELSRCTHAGWGIHNCGHGEDAGVYCQAYDIQLVNGPSANAGRIEVRNTADGDWGTICDDLFTIEDGHVACRMLGYSSATSVHSSATYGEGTGDIVLDNLECDSTEHGLSRCTHAGWGIHNCGHGEDAGVVCQ